MNKTNLQFYPFTSFVETNFWDLLIKKKITEYKLDCKPIDIISVYSYSKINFCDFEVDSDEIKIYGKIYLFNTLEEFKKLEKQKFLYEKQEIIFEQIKNTQLSELDLPKLLTNFYVLTYIDIKKYKCFYWFIFPAFNFPDNSYLLECPKKINSYFTEEQIITLYNLTENTTMRNKAFFTVYLNNDDILKVESIDKYLDIKDNKSKIFVTFYDSSKSFSHPGWTARNLLAFIYLKFKKKNITLLCLRKKNNLLNESIIFEIELEQMKYNFDYSGCVGFEKNEKNKLQPKIVDLSSNMDPKKIASNAVNLNLKLMRWRLIPNLNLEKICSTKCLLLGSGTLGCNVARCLIGWGITNITLVDNSQISFSNPVRQSLFEFSDCFPVQKEKCKVAAESLLRIHPNINAQGVNLSVLMPGHPISEEIWEKSKKNIETLERLIDTHDSIFLLMDTRESRWLPTVICHAKQKLVINAALGFDTYLIQRHGFTTNDNSFEPKLNKIPGSKLGCYYCNDVVAPGNSTKNRTLDQQCTVSRPGISMITAALAVELMVSILQHPEEKNAPAYILKNDEKIYENDSSLLGIIPHQIRGFLSQFFQVLPTCMAYKYCTGCSPKIINEYLKEGTKFLYKVFNDSNYLEEVSGIKKIQDDTDFSQVWVLSDDDN